MTRDDIIEFRNLLADTLWAARPTFGELKRLAERSGLPYHYPTTVPEGVHDLATEAIRVPRLLDRLIAHLIEVPGITAEAIENLRANCPDALRPEGDEGARLRSTDVGDSSRAVMPDHSAPLHQGPDADHDPTADESRRRRASINDLPIFRRIMFWDVSIRAALIGGACVIIAGVIALVPTLIGGGKAGTRPPSGRTNSPSSTSLTKASSVIRLTDPHSSGVRSVAYGNGGRIVAAGDANGSTYIWNVNTHTIVKTLPDPAGAGVQSVAIGQDGRILAAGDLNGKTYLWSLASYKIIKTLPDRGSKGVRSVAFGPGSTLAVGDDNGTIYLWNLATGKIVRKFHDPASTGVASVAFRPGGTTLAAGDLNDSAYLWNLTTGKVVRRLRDPGGGGIYPVAFSPDGAKLAVADGGGDAYVWDVAEHTIAKTLPDPDAAGDYSVAFGKGGATLATVDGNGNSYLWNLATRKVIHMLREPPGGGAEHFAFSPSWTAGAIANNDSVYIWTFE